MPVMPPLPVTPRIPAHTMGQGFDQAVQTAINHLPHKKAVVLPEYLDGYTITRVTSPRGEASYRVFDEGAWEPPATPPMLPWSAPPGVPVATVSGDGVVTLH